MRIFSSAALVFPGCPPDVADKRLGRRRGGVGFISLLEGYDEPEILRSSSRQFCLTSAEAGHATAVAPLARFLAPCIAGTRFGRAYR